MKVAILALLGFARWSVATAVWRSELASSVVYSPSGIGVGAYNQQGVSRYVYGWQGRDMIFQDFSEIAQVFGAGRTITVPIGSMTSDGEELMVSQSLCAYADQSNLKLLLSVSLSPLLESVGGIYAVLSDIAKVERAMGVLADSLDSSRCKEGIVNGIVLGTREDQIFPVAGTEKDTEAGVQQALALHADALRFLRAYVSSDLPILLNINLDQASLTTWSSLLPFVHTSASTAAPGSGSSARFDGVVLYVGPALRQSVPTITRVLPETLMVEPSDSGTSTGFGSFHIIVSVAESAYDADATFFGMNVDKQAAQLNETMDLAMRMVAPSVLRTPSSFPSQDEIERGQIFSGFMISEVKDQLWRVAASDGVVSCDSTGSGAGASPWFFDSSCFEQQLDPMGGTYPAVRSAVQRQGLMRQLEGGRSRPDALVGPEVCLRPRPAGALAVCYMQGAQNYADGSIPGAGGSGSSNGSDVRLDWGTLRIGNCLAYPDMTNQSDCSKLDVYRTLPTAEVQTAYGAEPVLIVASGLLFVSVAMLVLSYVCQPVKGAPSCVCACHARSQKSAEKAENAVALAAMRCCCGCCTPAKAAESTKPGIVNPLAGAVQDAYDEGERKESVDQRPGSVGNSAAAAGHATTTLKLRFKPLWSHIGRRNTVGSTAAGVPDGHARRNSKSFVPQHSGRNLLSGDGRGMQRAGQPAPGPPSALASRAAIAAGGAARRPSYYQLDSKRGAAGASMPHASAYPPMPRSESQGMYDDADVSVKVISPGAAKQSIDIDWQFESGDEESTGRGTGTDTASWQFGSDGTLSISVKLPRSSDFIGGDLGFRTHADTIMHTVTTQLVSCLLVIFSESCEGDSRWTMLRRLMAGMVSEEECRGNSTQMAHDLGILVHDSIKMLHTRLFDKARGVLLEDPTKSRRQSMWGEATEDVVSEQQVASKQSAREMLQSIVLYHLVFSQADSASHAPAIVAAVARRMAVELQGQGSPGEGAKMLHRAFNQTIQHMHVAPQRTVQVAQAWGSVHRTNFDDIEESWMAKVPPKVKKALQQQYDGATATTSPLQHAASGSGRVKDEVKRTKVKKAWSEARGPDVILDALVVFRPTILQWVWLMSVAGVFNIYTSERVIGGRVQTTDRWLESKRWLFTVSLVESTMLGVSSLLTACLTTLRQGNRPSGCWGMTTYWLAQSLRLGRPRLVEAVVGNRTCLQYCSQSTDIYGDIAYLRELLDACITLFFMAVLRFPPLADQHLDIALVYAAYRALLYFLYIAHDLLVCMENRCCGVRGAACCSPSRKGSACSPLMSLLCGMPDLGGEARALKRDGCGLSIVVLIQRTLLIYVLSVSVAPFFLNSTSGSFCSQACDSEVMPQGLRTDLAFQLTNSEMGDGVVWERSCQACQMGAGLNTILGALSVPYLDFMMVNLVFGFALSVLTCSTDSDRLCLYCAAARSSQGELHGGITSMVKSAYAVPVTETPAGVPSIGDNSLETRQKHIASEVLAAGFRDLRERDLLGDSDHNRIKRWAQANSDAPEPYQRDYKSMSPIAYRRLVSLLSAARRGIFTLNQPDFLQRTRTDEKGQAVPYQTTPEAGSVLIPAYGEPILANTSGRSDQGGNAWWAFRPMAEQGPVEGLPETIMVQRALQFDNEWKALFERWKRHLRQSSTEILQQLQKTRVSELEQKCLFNLGIDLQTHFEQRTTRAAAWAVPTESTIGSRSLSGAPENHGSYDGVGSGSEEGHGATGVRVCQVRKHSTPTEFLRGVHNACSLLTSNPRAVQHSQHPRHRLYQLFRAAQCAAQLWLSERTQTVGRTLVGAASYFEPLEAYASAARGLDSVDVDMQEMDAEMGGVEQAESETFENQFSQQFFQVVLSHQTIGGMKWKDNDVAPGKIGGTRNATTADRLVGLLATHPRLKGRNITVVTSVELGGLQDKQDVAETGGYQEFDKLRDRVYNKDYKARYGNKWLCYALLRGIFYKAHSLGIYTDLERHIRTTGEMKFALAFRVRHRDGPGRSNDWSLNDQMRWPGSPLQQGERQQVNIEVMRMIQRHAPLRLGKGLWATQGKAANQSMGIRFVTGHFCFTLDCNQDGWALETQKIPLLMRYTMYPRVPAPRSENLGVAKYIDDPSNTVTLVGLPEEIVTEDVSPVGSAEAVAESVFGRLYQRVFDQLAGLRMHYGHPDAWNTHYVRGAAGALSKASPQLNLSEDVFSGFIVAAKGYTSRHSDMLSWGKGREEVYLNALSFKFKISAGSGGVMRSRDMHQLSFTMSMHKNFALFHSLFGYFVTSGISFIMAVLLGLALALSSLSGQTSASLGGLYLSFASPWVLQAGALPVLLVIIDRCMQGEIARMVKEVFWSPLCLYHSTANEMVGYAIVSSVLSGEAGYVATGRGPSGGHVSWLTIAKGTWVLLLRSILQFALAGATIAVQPSGFFTISGLLVMLNGILVIMSSVAYSPHWWGNILDDVSEAWETLRLGQRKAAAKDYGTVKHAAVEKSDFVLGQFVDETQLRHPLGLLVRVLAAWGIVVVLCAAQPAVAAEYTWTVWGTIIWSAMSIVLLWALALAFTECCGRCCGPVNPAEEEYSCGCLCCCRKPANRSPPLSHELYNSTSNGNGTATAAASSEGGADSDRKANPLKAAAGPASQSYPGCCSVFVSTLLDQLIDTPPWRWALATAVAFICVFGIGVIYAGGPTRVVALGLSLGFITCYMVASAISYSMLLITGLVLRLHASFLGFCRHGELPCSSHQGDLGENGVLRRAKLVADPQAGGVYPVLQPVPEHYRHLSAEDVAISALQAYSYVQRAVFDGFGLRVLSYVVLGVSLVLHIGLQTVFGLVDLITGLLSAWAFCSFPAMMQHSVIFGCLRKAVRPD